MIFSDTLVIKDKPKTAEEEVQILTSFMNYYQDEADKLTQKTS